MGRSAESNHFRSATLLTCLFLFVFLVIHFYCSTTHWKFKRVSPADTLSRAAFPGENALHAYNLPTPGSYEHNLLEVDFSKQAEETFNQTTVLEDEKHAHSAAKTTSREGSSLHRDLHVAYPRWGLGWLLMGDKCRFSGPSTCCLPSESERSAGSLYF